MGIYDGLSEEDLEAKVAQLRAAYEELQMGTAVVRVANEGRLMEFSRANGTNLRRLLNDAISALARLRGEDPDSAIGVIFP